MSTICVGAALSLSEAHAQMLKPYSDPLLKAMWQRPREARPVSGFGEVALVAMLAGGSEEAQWSAEWALRKAGIYFYEGGSQNRGFYVFKAYRDAALKTVTADSGKNGYRIVPFPIHLNTDALAAFDPPYARLKGMMPQGAWTVGGRSYVVIGAIGGLDVRALDRVGQALGEAGIGADIAGSNGAYISVRKEDRDRALRILETDANDYEYGIVLYSGQSGARIEAAQDGRPPRK